MSEARAERLRLAPEYGSASGTLAWRDVRARLEAATHYGLRRSGRTAGRPHVIPLDGLWHEDGWHFGGSADTVKHRNLEADPRAVLHLEDTASAVIAEGTCEWLFPDGELAERLAALSKEKYGFAPEPAVYTRTGVWCVRPARALSWQRFPRDATRFVV